jgi:hypothetical protein
MPQQAFFPPGGLSVSACRLTKFDQLFLPDVLILLEALPVDCGWMTS